MTRTAIQLRELSETERHNREQEKAAIYNAIAGAVGATGSVLRGAKAGIKTVHNPSDTRYNINYNVTARGKGYRR